MTTDSQPDNPTPSSTAPAVDKDSEAAADNRVVDDFATQMKSKLQMKRDQGRSGWQTCPPEELSRLLREHVNEKNDTIDVANFAMMLWFTYGSIMPRPETQVFATTAFEMPGSHGELTMASWQAKDVPAGTRVAPAVDSHSSEEIDGHQVDAGQNVEGAVALSMKPTELAKRIAAGENWRVLPGALRPSVAHSPEKLRELREATLTSLREMVVQAGDNDGVRIGALPDPSQWMERTDGFGVAPLWDESALCAAIKTHILAERAAVVATPHQLASGDGEREAFKALLNELRDAATRDGMLRQSSLYPVALDAVLAAFDAARAAPKANA